MQRRFAFRVGARSGQWCCRCRGQCSEYCANKPLNRSGDQVWLATVGSLGAARLAWSLAQQILSTTLVVSWATLDRLVVRFGGCFVLVSSWDARARGVLAAG